jgi:hypothetical protein
MIFLIFWKKDLPGAFGTWARQQLIPKVWEFPDRNLSLKEAPEIRILGALILAFPFV